MERVNGYILLVETNFFSHKQLVLVTAPISIGAFFCCPGPNH